MIRPAEQQQFLPDRAEQRAHWHWPVDLTAYDRSPAFRKQELLDLDQVMNRLFLPPVLPASLERVIQPINDVLEVSTSYLKNRQYARRTLLVEMQRRRTPFWAWTSEDWMDILRKNSTEFEQRYPGAPTCRQQVLTIAYLLCDFTDFHKLGAFLRKTLADTTFGATRMETTIQQVVEGTRQWGLTRRNDLALYSVVREALLTNRSPYLEDLTYDLLLMMRERTDTLAIKRALGTLSCALLALGLFNKTFPEVPLPSKKKVAHPQKLLIEETATVAPEWLQYCQRWHATSTLTYSTRQKYYCFLLKTGRWLTQKHPEYLRPGDWTREFVATCVAFVDQQRLGDWIEPGNAKKIVKGKVGQPVGPRYKMHFLAALRTFFLDCQEWGWIPRRFDPRRTLGTPRSIRALVGPNPRVISDDIWFNICTQSP